MSEAKVATTAAGDVLLPVEDVKLTGKALRSKTGEPLVVRCEFIEEVEFLRLVESAPGHSPDIGIQTKRSNLDTSRALLKYAPGLIGTGTVLVGADGSEQRPAFHFGADPKDGSLPGRFLSTPEKLHLLLTILRLSGYTGGAADSVRFHDGDGAGSGDGKRGVGAGEWDGDAAGSAAVRRDEGTPDANDAGAGG